MKTIKCRFSSILRKDIDYSKIYDCISRTNNLTSLCMFFIRSYLLHKYELNEDFPTFDNKFVRTCIIVVSEKSRGAKVTTPYFKELTLFFEKFSKDCNMKKINAHNLSYIKNYEITQILTAYSNNIKNNFMKYVNQFVNESHNIPHMKKLNREEYLKLSTVEKNKHSQDKKQFQETLDDFMKEIKLVKKDLIENTLNSDNKYHDWINNVRNNIFPKCNKKNIILDMFCDPLKYLKSMITMNRLLEDNGKKLFQCLPIRTDICKKYVTFDTSAINDIFSEIVKEDGKYISSGKNVWIKYFDLSKLKINNYVFNDMISTDGLSVSISFIEKSEYCAKQQKHKMMSEVSIFIVPLAQ